MVDNALGEFLRARRALVRPEDVGLPRAGVRRTPGLRREEVAGLAGVSIDYYLRLEQGRDRTPSVQVVDALAGVLRLDATATAYLLDLARPKSRRTARTTTEKVPEGTRRLLGSLGLPALVQNHRTDVLAANAPAEALSPHMAAGVNRLRALFTDPAARDLHPDWADGTADLVAQLRAAGGDDPRLTALVAELSAASDRFRQLWERHEVRPRTGATTRLRHPELGELELYREKLAVLGAGDLVLVIYHAEPGSPSAAKLARLSRRPAAAGATGRE
jgi:transcriptional regulator with XRE-family HTH domain